MTVPERFKALFGTADGAGKAIAITFTEFRKLYGQSPERLAEELGNVNQGHGCAAWEDRFTGNIMIERKRDGQPYFYAGKEWMKRVA